MIVLASTSTYVQYAMDSVAYGSLFALMALSLSLLFGVMGLMNFAYGELIGVGAYTMFYTERYGWFAMVLATFATVIVAALLMELIAFRPVRRASPSTLLITSFALSIGLQKLAYILFPPGSPRTVEPIPWLTNQFEVKGVLFSRLEILTWVVTIVLLVGMVLLLKRTALGIQLRASTEDFRMAQLVGVKANWVISSAFAITGFLAAAVTILYMLNHGDVRPNVGQGPLLIAFVGVVIGGLGSLGGAALGGFTLGVMINIFSATLPRSIQGHTLMFAFLLVILMLVFQPNGIMGTVEKLRRKRAAREVPPLVAEEPAS
jgi:branched-chain amino acid transport system permease protein